MDTKMTGDIAEHGAVLHVLKRGWGVLRPIGERMPYDLMFDVGGPLVKIQVWSPVGIKRERDCLRVKPAG
jgi:hypothetical protein